MKGDRPRITLLGSNSGNNLGDAAIMSSIFESFSRAMPDVEFFVPTTKPSFTNKHYGKRYNAKGVSMMPWTGSIRFVGLSTFWCLMKSDVALICDGIIFGKKLWNPFFNWLIALIFVVPFARLVGCKVVCYSCGIGPFPIPISRTFARWVLNGCDLVIMREHDSEKLAREIGVTKPIEVTGDAAFINPVSSDARAEEILRAEGLDLNTPTLGINVTKYMDTWLSDHERLTDPSSFLRLLADGINDARARLSTRFQCVVFSTHPMDEGCATEVAKLLDGKSIFNSKYLSHDIQAVMRRCELFMGMRFHSVILASAVEVPIVGLIYAPKVRGYMRLLGCQEYALELGKLTRESLSESVYKAWNERVDLKARQKKVIDVLKSGAHRATWTVSERYFGVAPETEIQVERHTSYVENQT